MKPAVVFLILLSICCVALFICFLLWIKLWMRAVLAGAPIPLVHLLAMRLRKINVADIVDAYIVARKTGVDIGVADLEMHLLAGGNAPQTVAGLAAAAEAAIPLSFNDACAIDLAGRDVVEEVRGRISGTGYRGPAIGDSHLFVVGVPATRSGVRCERRRVVRGAPLPGRSAKGAGRRQQFRPPLVCRPGHSAAADPGHPVECGTPCPPNGAMAPGGGSRCRNAIP